MNRRERINQLVDTALSLPHLTCKARTLKPGAPLCGGTSFSVFPGPTGIKLRCDACWSSATAAVCTCGHSYLSHGRTGCLGYTDNDDACDCQLKGGR